MDTTNLQKWPILGVLEPEFTSQIHMVVVFGSLGNEALIVTKDKMVYALGDNNGCLGIENKQSIMYPEKVENLCGENIKTFACGGKHALMLTQKGQVYSLGKNAKPELLNIHPWQYSISSRHITEIACRGDHSVALTDTGEVNKVKVACGYDHTLALTDEGELYAWGENSNGQLGIDSFESKQPCRINMLTQTMIVKVACGHSHTLALTKEGVLYAWGANDHGQLEIGHLSKMPNPVPVDGIRRVSDIAAVHYNHISVAVDKRGRVYMWELLKLAIMYHDSDLEEQCTQLIKQGITVSNVAYLYNIANKDNAEELKDFCFEFILDNLTSVMQTEGYNNLDEKLARALVIKAAKVGIFKT